MTNALARWGVTVLAVLGLVDALYLSVLHWQGEIPPCGGYAGCETVNTSPFAEIFSVPVAAFGMAPSAAILAVALYRLQATGINWLYSTSVLYALVLGGALFMAYLTGVEVLVLRAVCYWCLAMATFILLMLILVIRDIWVYTAKTAT